MMKNAFTRGLLLTAATVVVLGAGACGGPEVPAEPTWERDIRPLMEARCIRCHDTPGHEDPLVRDDRVSRPSAISFNVQRFEDLNAAARIYLMNQAVSAVKGSVVPPATALNYGRMPPPPAEALEEWQIEMLEKWTKNPR